MPSRKRNKGKARKSKAVAAATSAAASSDGRPRNGQLDHEQAHILQGETPICRMMRNISLEDQRGERACDHGCPHPPEGDICNKFVVSFNERFAGSMPTGKSSQTQTTVLSKCIFDAVNEGFMSVGAGNQHLWEESTNLRKLVSYMESLGTDILLQFPAKSAFPLALAIMIVETMETKQSDLINTLFGPTRDFFDDMERETTRFFAKRNKCHCLKEQYSQLRKKPSSGMCHHCEERKDRKDLKICTCCKIAQYCSKQCQAADWPKHRKNVLSTKALH